MSYRQGMNIASIHVFVGGEGREITFDQIDVTEHPSASELITAVELHLDLAAGLLRNYEVEGYESTGQVVLRPVKWWYWYRTSDGEEWKVSQDWWEARADRTAEGG